MFSFFCSCFYSSAHFLWLGGWQFDYGSHRNTLSFIYLTVIRLLPHGGGAALCPVIRDLSGVRGTPGSCFAQARFPGQLGARTKRCYSGGEKGGAQGPP